MSSRRWSDWTRAVAAAVALLVPSRLSGPLDGMPLSGVAEALAIGLLFPMLVWREPAFLRTKTANWLVVALLAWKAATGMFLVQDGWCVRVEPSRPYAADATGAPHSWDVRADWRSSDPACAAIMTDGYHAIAEFPVWFYNLPPAVGVGEEPLDRPPAAVSTMHVRGYLTTKTSGTLQLDVTPDVRLAGAQTTMLDPGQHAIALDMTLTGKRWRFVPTWNGANPFFSGLATVSPPRTIDGLVRPWGAWVTFALAFALLGLWLFDALRRVADGPLIAWSAGASAAIAGLTLAMPVSRWHYVIAGLLLACALPVGRRVRNLRGLFWLVGVPWLTFVVVLAWPQIGRITFYGVGNDFWRFQRWAYRIYLQGYWLEGGEPTFWFQPLHRWTVGALHVVFGDSSVGEFYWDGACLLIMAVFSYELTRRFAGFRWGVAAAVASLALFLAGPGYVFIGRGLSEITSAGFVYLAALVALRSRHGSWRTAVLAGVLAVLALYTRLNNAPMAAAVVLFAWPVREPIATLAHPSRWFARCSWRTVIVVIAALAVGLTLFAMRTWHYTGNFSIFQGTALDASRGVERRVWMPGMSISAGLHSMYESVMIVLTTSEPPQVHTGSLPLMAAAVIAALAFAGVPGLRRLPANAVLFLLATLSGALIARGTAYSGRFSIHYVPIATAIATCTAAMAWNYVMTMWTPPSQVSTDRARTASASPSSSRRP